MFDNFDEFKKLHPALANLKPENMVKDGLSAPLHEGAHPLLQGEGLDQVTPRLSAYRDGPQRRYAAPALPGHARRWNGPALGPQAADVAADIEKAPEALRVLVADSDTGGRAASGATATLIFAVAVAWSLFQLW